MGMTGLQIYKLLPKTNCKKCGYSACLAYGMALAAGKTDAGKCPDMSEKLRSQIEESSLAPVRESVFGNAPVQFKAGGEKVSYRHEETFYNKPCIAVALDDSLDNDDFIDRVSFISSFSVERAGVRLETGAVALIHSSGDFLSKAGMIGEERPLILICDDSSVMEEAVSMYCGRKPLIICRNASKEQIEAWMDKGCAVGVYGKSADEFDEKAADIKTGYNAFFVYDGTIGDAMECMAVCRRSAVAFRQKTYPFAAICISDDIDDSIMNACAFVQRYAGCVVVPFCSREKLMPVLTLAANIYSDPRRPVQVEPGIYPINNPGKNSPVFITTNFSLTHFLVSSEIEASRIPVWLVIADTDGTSLLTAWAADKFNASVIAKTLEKTGIGDKVDHRTLTICAYVSSLKEEIENESGWKVIIGSADASGISPWLKKLDPSSLV